MSAYLWICIVTCAVMIASILLFPKIKIGKVNIGSYWVIVLAGAVILLATGQADIIAVGQALLADTAVNPIKILVLFLSMTVLSVYLDELGFFRYLAYCTLRHAGLGQKKLFLYLYITVSILTVFTSNDIIILSFTPFICYFAKHAKINPAPYLTAEFVAANTWSMALIIGNPTNIYLATAYGVGFVDYLSVMILPTLAAGATAFCMLFLLFRKDLAKPMESTADKEEIGDKVNLMIGIVHLAVCTVFLAISGYVGIEMWLVSLCTVGSLFVCILLASLVRKKKPKELLFCLKRAPYELIPFVLSMFVMIVVLDGNGVTEKIASFLETDYNVFTYGYTSFLAANVINNIPMSVLFSSVLQSSSNAVPALYATVIGSNVGAFLTPIGALAGIMWNSILAKNGIRYGIKNFVKMGLLIAVPTLTVALLALWGGAEPFSGIGKSTRRRIA